MTMFSVYSTSGGSRYKVGEVGEAGSVYGEMGRGEYTYLCGRVTEGGSVSVRRGNELNYIGKVTKSGNIFTRKDGDNFDHEIGRVSQGGSIYERSSDGMFNQKIGEVPGTDDVLLIGAAALLLLFN